MGRTSFSEEQQIKFQEMTVVEENVTEETLDKHETYIEHLEEQAEIETDHEKHQ